METIPFHDYSNVLTPLPPLGPEVPPPLAGTAPTSGLSFADELNSRLSTEESQNVETVSQDTSIFDLAAPRTSIAHNPIPLYDSNDAIPLTQDSILLSGNGPDLVNEEERELMRVCREIEGFLLGILLKNLGKDFGGSGLFNRTSESGYYQDMFFYELADTIGGNPPGTGIAERLYTDIILKMNAGSIDQVA